MNAINNVQSLSKIQQQDRKAVARHIIGFVCWFLGLIVLIVASWIVHGHPQPWPFELTVSRDVQAWHIPGWLHTILITIGIVNDPIPSGFAAAVLVGVLILRHYLRPALFIGYLVLVANSIDAIIGDMVARPRPSPHLIHVTSILTFNSFPSGHTEHVVIFYGFLFFLTLTKPVREWKYARWLLPLQILLLLDILLMGFTRVLEGEHWLLDVSGGYLSGLLWLTLFIYLYHRTWTRNEPGAWQKGKAAEKA